MTPSRTPKDRDALETYRRKRSVEHTPEPAGTVAARDGHTYVMHKHDATRLHFDLRLEFAGVLKSWAVPRGPSRNPADKRVAVFVEDHPIEYAEFEGVIPEGNYGAGAVIVWDRGVYVPLEDFDEGFEKGKLLFELKGYKLRGRWTLVKIKKSEKDWLLIKERDSYASENGEDFPQDSVLSGLTVEEMGAGSDRAQRIRARLAELDAPVRQVDADAVDLMLAESRTQPFSGDDWVFELKYDGYRMVAQAGNDEGRLRTRNGRDATASFPEIARALRALPYGHVVMDGEVVVHDEAGLPSFQRLQKRARISHPIDVRRAAAELPATLYLFDLLAFGDRDLRSLPLSERKALLREILPNAGPLRFADHVEEQGEAFYAGVERMGLEGMVAKRASSPYRGGRRPEWVKVRASPTDDFVVVGHTRPKGSRGGFGSLHLATHVNGELTYTGTAGSGFTDRQLRETHSLLQTMRREDPPCIGAPAGKEHTWVEPRLVCEVRYVEVTEEGLLRQPVFVRFRDDVRPEDVVRRNATGDADDGPAMDAGPADGERDVEPTDGDPDSDAADIDASADDSAAFDVAQERVVKRVAFSNLDKVFWPVEGYTKGDLVAYYRSIAPWILPYLRDRPVVLTRFPDGIEGKSFFQKDAPAFAPEWLRTETIYSDQSERDLRYFVCDDEPSLLYLANSATIPLHVWASRIGSLELPDWCILDLDPKEAPFDDVIEVARFLHGLCEEIELPAFVKTSGSSGLHVLVPLGRQLTFDQTRTMGELIARVAVAELPDIATITRIPSKREGKVYVDYLQNGHGKLLVAPFCVRPLPGAPVSTPLDWKDVKTGLDIRAFTIRSVPRRFERRKHDPLRPLLVLRPDLVRALERLYARL
jgi:bifunctional non-homologous end joining protein LigD